MNSRLHNDTTGTRDLSSWLWRITLGALLLLAGVLGWTSQREYDETLAQEFRYLESHVRFGDSQIAGALRGVDLLLQSVTAAQLASPPQKPLDIQRHQLALLAKFPEIHFLIVTDASGHVLTAESLDDPASAARVRSFDASQRDYFKVHRDTPPSANGVAISRPFKTITNQTTIAVSRAIRDKDGRFRGVALVSLSPGYFDTVLQQALPGVSSSLAVLLNRSGDVIYHSPNPGAYVGKSVADASAFKAYIESEKPLVRHIGTAVLDGAERIFVVGRIGDTSLGISLSTRLDAVLGEWRRQLLLKISAFCLTTILAFMLLREFRRRMEEHRRLETALRENEIQLSALVEFSPIPMVIATAPPEGRNLMLNKRFTEVFGYQLADVPEQATWWLRFYPDPALRQENKNKWKIAMEEMAAAGRNNLDTPFSAEVQCKNGLRRQVEINLTILPTRCLIVFDDVTDRKRAEDELRTQAATDFLTGLASRRSFMARLEDELARLHRSIEQPIALLMLDLDHFKQVNDTHGHATGDELLKHFADIVMDELRRIDMAGRLGGEEFGIVLPGADLSAAYAFAERLRQRVSQWPLQRDGKPDIAFAVSTGVTLLGMSDTGPDVALARADRALYRAKELGRNRVEVSAEGA